MIILWEKDIEKKMNTRQLQTDKNKGYIMHCSESYWCALWQ